MTDLTASQATAPAGAASAVSWAAILAGAVVALAVSLIMVTLGSGLGAAAVSPWPNVGPGPATFTVVTGVWLIITQWVSAAIGGYLTGRLRTRWVSLHTHEVFFRDTAHGLLAWSVATAVVAALAATAAAPAVHSVGAALAAGGTPDASDAARQAADSARKAAVGLSLFTSVSMLVGAFIACVSAALGGQLRDLHP